jgi:hypothetical protein
MEDELHETIFNRFIDSFLKIVGVVGVNISGEIEG